MMHFEVGDTVKLKSGGPAMTINRLDSEMGVTHAHCQWFDQHGNIQDHFYLVTSLTPTTQN